MSHKFYLKKCPKIFKILTLGYQVVVKILRRQFLRRAVFLEDACFLAGSWAWHKNRGSHIPNRSAQEDKAEKALEVG